MPTGHRDAPAICRLEDSSRGRQPCSFLRWSGLRARRRSRLRSRRTALHSAQARAELLVLLPSILALSPFALLSSLFYPHVWKCLLHTARRTVLLLKGDGNIGGFDHSMHS